MIKTNSLKLNELSNFKNKDEIFNLNEDELSSQKCDNIMTSIQQTWGNNRIANNLIEICGSSSNSSNSSNDGNQLINNSVSTTTASPISNSSSNYDENEYATYEKESIKQARSPQESKNFNSFNNRSKLNLI